MEGRPEYVVDPNMQYADIIVPTMDTVRASYIIELLLTNGKQVLCVGPTGTGKTLTVVDKLLKTMPSNYLSHIVSFSARTSANQTQVSQALEGKRFDDFLFFFFFFAGHHRLKTGQA